MTKALIRILEWVQLQLSLLIGHLAHRIAYLDAGKHRDTPTPPPES